MKVEVWSPDGLEAAHLGTPIVLTVDERFTGGKTVTVRSEDGGARATFELEEFRAIVALAKTLGLP